MIRRLLLALALCLVPALSGAQASRTLVLLPQTTIAAALTGATYDLVRLPAGVHSLTTQCVFLYGSAGTTAKVWVQTSLDGGATWVDVVSCAYTTTAGTKVNSVKASTAVTANYTPTDGTLTDNTIKDGIIGDRARVKVTTTGVYAGATSLKVTAVIQ